MTAIIGTFFARRGENANQKVLLTALAEVYVEAMQLTDEPSRVIVYAR
jgi:hypothetical protein